MLFDVFSHNKGYELICVFNAEETLASLTPESQVMFLDLKLPGGMNGLEFCRQIRKEHPAACIYVMTGYSSRYELANCRNAGSDDFDQVGNAFYMVTEQAFKRVAVENKSK